MSIPGPRKPTLHDFFFLYRSFEKHADREEKPMKILTTLLGTATENSTAAKDAALFQTIVEKA